METELRELFERRGNDVSGSSQLPAALRRRIRLYRVRYAIAAMALVGAAFGAAAGIQAVSQPREAVPAEKPEVPDPDGSAVGWARPTASRLSGIWMNEGRPSPGWEDTLIRFSPDGTMAVDDRGFLDLSPAVLGTYELDGDRITITAGPGSGACVAGDSWAFEGAVSEEGRLKTVVVEDGIGSCHLGIGNRWTWTRVSPRSAAGAEISAPGSPAGTPKDIHALHGVWLLEGSGRLLRLSTASPVPFGTYALDDDGDIDTEPDDAGTIDLVGGGTLMLTSGTQSRQCADGDVMVWDILEYTEGSLRAEVTRDTCTDRLGVLLIWIRLTGGS
jgi:hypothetical protein